MLPITVLLDTNVLYHAMDYGINIKESANQLISTTFEIYIHSMVQEEIIQDLALPNKRGLKAKLAVQLMTEFQPYEDDRLYEGTDTALLETARRISGIIFTFDKELRDRCKDMNIPVITLHAKGKVQLLGYVP